MMTKATHQARPSAARPDAARPIVWSIAASDSGGGAGLQADNLTIYDLGAHPCNIVTAITAQNSVGVSDIEAVSLELLASQLNCLLADMPPSAIKIGVLANAQQVQCLTLWLADTLAAYQAQHQRLIPVIWDPVMLASTGQALTEQADIPSIDDYWQLAKQVSLLTPNASEFLTLLSRDTAPTTDEHWQLLLEMLAAKLNTNVLLSGGDQCRGDQDGVYATDWLATRDVAHTGEKHQNQLIAFQSARINTQNNHGTGCTFSAAIASVMALGYPLLDAIALAKAYINRGLAAGYQPGQGAGVLARCGWPDQLENFPLITLPYYPFLREADALQFAEVLTPLQPYPVTESLQILQQVLAASARTAQLRIKASINQAQLEQDIQQAIALGKQFNAQVFINDHWQLAIKHGAFGVHLGQEDMFDADFRQIAQAGLALGLSSHGYFELLIAQQLQPSYLAIGHIFATPTKNMASQAQGLVKLKRYCQLLKGKLPLVAIGGIGHDNLAQLKATGIDDIAVVRAIEQADNPALSWQNLQQQWQDL